MILELALLPETLKGPEGDGYRCKIPKRMLYAAPDAALSILRMEKDGVIVVHTDIFRSADASLAALRTKRGVQRPAYSGHNYGFSRDLDVDATLTLNKWTYAQLLEAMSTYGWFCHRRDGSRGAEDWHFNHFGTQNPQAYLDLTDPGDKGRASWARPLEDLLQEHYGVDFDLGPILLQQDLARLSLYSGDVDGIVGPLTREAVGIFQRAWGLMDDGIPGPITQRTLAYVSSQINIGSVGLA